MKPQNINNSFDTDFQNNNKALTEYQRTNMLHMAPLLQEQVQNLTNGSLETETTFTCCNHGNLWPYPGSGIIGPWTVALK